MKKILTYLILFLLGFFGYKGISNIYNKFFKNRKSNIEGNIKLNLKEDKVLSALVYSAIGDFSHTDAIKAFKICCKLEGIIPALEPAHALSFVLKFASKQNKKHILVMNMCGRGDKDIFAISKNLGFDF